MTTLVRGDKLQNNVKSDVLRRYVHRMTDEARAQWPGFTQTMLAGGYRMPRQTDDQWLATKAFYVIDDGSRLDARHISCVPAYLIDPYVSGDDVDLDPETAAQYRADRKADDLAMAVENGA